MVKVTKAQRSALARVYSRSPLGISFLAFRRTVQGTFGMDGAVVVRWQGMWLCIEADGYCHT
jgi:hypothetical protein